MKKSNKLLKIQIFILSIISSKIISLEINNKFRTSTERSYTSPITHSQSITYSPQDTSGNTTTTGPYGDTVSTSYEQGEGTVYIAPTGSSTETKTFAYGEYTPKQTYSITQNSDGSYTVTTPFGISYQLPSNMTYNPTNESITITTKNPAYPPSSSVIFYGPQSSTPGTLTTSNGTDLGTFSHTEDGSSGTIAFTPSEATFYEIPITGGSVSYTMGTVTTPQTTYNAISFEGSRATGSQSSQGYLIVDPGTGYVTQLNRSYPTGTTQYMDITKSTPNNSTYSFYYSGNLDQSDYGIKNEQTGGSIEMQMPTSTQPGNNPELNIFTANGGSLSILNDPNTGTYEVFLSQSSNNNPYFEQIESNLAIPTGGGFSTAKTPYTMSTYVPYTPLSNTIYGGVYYNYSIPSSSGIQNYSQEVAYYQKNYAVSNDGTLTITTEINPYSSSTPPTYPYEGTYKYGYTTTYTPGDSSNEIQNTKYYRTPGTFTVTTNQDNSLSWQNNGGTIDYTKNGTSGSAQLTFNPESGLTLKGNSNTVNFDQGELEYNGIPIYYDPYTQSFAPAPSSSTEQ